MNPTPGQKMYSAVSSGDIAAVQEILRTNPEILSNPAIGASWLNLAARRDNVAMVEFLVRAGLDVNATKEGDSTSPLVDAASTGCVQVARWLLDHGATIKPACPGEGGRTLIGAVNSGSLEMVRLLLERGADVNACYGSPPQNALSHALAYGHKEIAELLRAHGATLPDPGPPAGPAELRQDILRHVEYYLGAVQPLALTEILPGTVAVSIHVVSPTPERRWLTLFTTGMSDRTMTVPAGSEEYRYAELLLRLPGSWPLTTEALQKPENSWPVEWLRRIGHYPHDNQTWLAGAYAVISNGEPPAPLAPNTRLTSFLLLAEPSDAGQIRCRDGKVIQFYSVFPLYTEERDLVLTDGPAKLLALFQKSGISMVVDIGRRNVARVHP
jgi:hypothetical protein